jgi:hypothetical protein
MKNHVCATHVTCFPTLMTCCLFTFITLRFIMEGGLLSILVRTIDNKLPG